MVILERRPATQASITPSTPAAMLGENHQTMQTQEPQIEVVAGEEGEALWQVCALGMCIRDKSRSKAEARLADLQRAKGISTEINNPT